MQCYGIDLSHVGTPIFQKEEERLRASIRRENMQRRVKERANQRGLNAAYLEDDMDDDDEDTSIRAIKERYKKNVKRRSPLSCTVKLVYKDHHRDQQNVVLICRWSLYAGSTT